MSPKFFERCCVFMASALLVLPFILVATPARADETALIVFYGSLQIAQSQALKASSNYYKAIGMGARGQDMLRLAADFEHGSLGGADGVKTFAQVSDRMESDILELQAVGALPTAQQKALADQARQQMAVAKTSMVVAIAAGTKAALDVEGDTLKKILLGVLLAAEAAKVLESINQVSAAAKAYQTFELGGSNGFQVVSKECQPAFAAL